MGIALDNCFKKPRHVPENLEDIWSAYCIGATSCVLFFFKMKRERRSKSGAGRAMEPRDADDLTRYVELYVVNDYSQVNVWLLTGKLSEIQVTYLNLLLIKCCVRHVAGELSNVVLCVVLVYSIYLFFELWVKHLHPVCCYQNLLKDDRCNCNSVTHKVWMNGALVLIWIFFLSYIFLNFKGGLWNIKSYLT